jgi:hypothetical protein
LLPELDAGAKELRESEELAKLNLVRERFAAAQANVALVTKQHWDAMDAISRGAADPVADVEKLQRQAEKVGRDLTQKEHLVEVLAEEWRLRRMDVEERAKQIESGFRSIDLIAFEEVSVIRAEIGKVLTPLLDRYSRIMEAISRKDRSIPNRAEIIGPDPPSSERPEIEPQHSPFMGVPVNYNAPAAKPVARNE